MLRDLRRGERRLEEVERVQLEERGRPRLRGQVDGERGLVADRHLVRDAVEVAVDVVADDLHRLHAQLVVGGAAIEVAQERDAALPLERPDDQLGPAAGLSTDGGKSMPRTSSVLKVTAHGLALVRVALSVPKLMPLVIEVRPICVPPSRAGLRWRAGA